MEFLKINNRENFLLSEVPTINPFSRRYNSWWKLNKKRCIEGFWSIDDKKVKLDIADEKMEFPESNSWRYIPPTAYFYGNFGNILRNRKGTTSGAKQLMRPNLDDVEWEFGYNWIEARGFSGFEFDQEYSSNRLLLGYMLEDKLIPYTDEELIGRCLDEHNEIIPLLYNNYFKINGDRKKYIPARKYIRQIFTEQMGRPIYGNIPKNLMILGTRDGGKSYLVANQGIAHELLFDGMRYYDGANIQGSSPIAEIVVGASISDKSRDLITKVKYTLDNLPGAWKKGTPQEIPCPFYKHMGGSTEANKEWRHTYQIKQGNDWQKFEGSFIKHRVFTTENPEAAAGGRPGTIVLEEVGLVGNLLSIHSSNDAAQNDGGEKFGSTLYIGTAGNMEKILEPEIVFNHPADFDFLEFDNIWEEQIDKICWFIPAHYMARRFKDENGNTKVSEALEHFMRRRAAKSKGASKKGLDGEMLNYPLKPSEMFINKNNNKFPIADIKIRIRDLLSSNNDELKNTYRGFYSIDEKGNVRYDKSDKLSPMREFPLKKDDTNLEGCMEMFEPPIKNNDGNVPPNIYAAAMDPVDDDGNDNSKQSLQSFYIMNLLTDRIVLEYTARTKFAKDFYEQCRRALIDYNCTLLYENQKKGLYTYFDQKNSLYLLEDTPQALKDTESQKGNFTGNRAKGIYNTPKLKYWGEQDLLPAYLDSKAYNAEGEQTNLQIFKSLGGLREMVYYDGKSVNTDRISSLGILMIARELKLKHKVDIKKRKKKIAEDPFFNRHHNYSSMGPSMTFNN